MVLYVGKSESWIDNKTKPPLRIKCNSTLDSRESQHHQLEIQSRDFFTSSSSPVKIDHRAAAAKVAEDRNLVGSIDAIACQEQTNSNDDDSPLTPQ